MYRCEHCGTDLANAAAVLVHLLHLIARMERLMTEFANDQAHLDADVQAENDAIAAIEAEIADLKSKPADQPLDFSGIDAAVARLKGDAPAPAAPPAETPPADNTTTDGTDVPAPVHTQNLDES